MSEFCGHGKRMNQCIECCRSEPNPSLEALTLEAIASYIKSPSCKKIGVLSGAGISAANGIPTYRGKGGLYETLDATKLSASPAERAELATPEAVFGRDLFLRNPLPCLEMKREFVLDIQRGAYSPTIFHRLVELIARAGKLSCVFDQNIDGLMFRCADLPPHLVRTPHGRIDQAGCERCGHAVDFSAMCAHLKDCVKDLSGLDSSAPAESTGMVCERCGEAAVKPRSVLFGAPLQLKTPIEHDSVLDDLDLLIIAGTTLKVGPINGIPLFVPRHCVRLVLNDTPVGEHLQPMPLQYGADAVRDVHLEGTIDAASWRLIEALGWTPSLMRTFRSGHMPMQSRRLIGEMLLGRTMPKSLPYVHSALDPAMREMAAHADAPIHNTPRRDSVAIAYGVGLQRTVHKSAAGRLLVRLGWRLMERLRELQGAGGSTAANAAAAEETEMVIQVSDRTLHDVSKNVHDWLMGAMVDLQYRLPFHMLPPEARADAEAQHTALHACLTTVDAAFELFISDPTGESWIA